VQRQSGLGVDQNLEAFVLNIPLHLRPPFLPLHRLQSLFLPDGIDFVMDFTGQALVALGR
jgi:hypothetical protein